KEPQIHDFRQMGLPFGQALQRLVQREVVNRAASGGRDLIIDLLARSAAAAFDSLSLTCVIHKDLAHGSRRGREEMSPTVKRKIAGPAKPEERFMHQGGGLERSPGRFGRHGGFRETSKLG